MTATPANPVLSVLKIMFGVVAGAAPPPTPSGYAWSSNDPTMVVTPTEDDPSKAVVTFEDGTAIDAVLSVSLDGTALLASQVTYDPSTGAFAVNPLPVHVPK